METIRVAVTFAVLTLVKGLSRLFFRHDLRWVGEVPPDPWSGIPEIRVLALLHHTSLWEPVFAGMAPNRLLWRIARHGIAPVADKTFARPLVGRFFQLLARRVIPISRERDETWTRVLERTDDPDAMVLILPEGRMMRRTGLDRHGEPMTVRGGIADILQAIPRGKMLLAYSGGLHHVHAPGDARPRLFRTVRLRIELVDIPAYRRAMEDRAAREGGFKAAVVADLTRRRDRHGPTGEGTAAAG